MNNSLGGGLKRVDCGNVFEKSIMVNRKDDRIGPALRRVGPAATI